MNLDINKIKVVSFTRKYSTLIYEHKRCLSSVTCTDPIEDVGIFLGSKLHFHNHVNSILSQCMKVLGLVCSVTLSSSLDSVCLSLCIYCGVYATPSRTGETRHNTFFLALVRPKLEYVCCLEFCYIYECQQAGTHLGKVHSPVFPHVHYSYTCTVDFLELHTLHNRRYYCNALFLIQSYVGSK
jgi:hypothetical protein